MGTFPKSAILAREARLGSGDSIIGLSTKLGIPAWQILRMESGHEGYSAIAMKVRGHYRGVLNAFEPECPVGRRLRQLRQRAGDTQETLAEKLGCPAPYVSKIERNPLRWSKRMARRIAEIYGVNGEELVGSAVA